MSTWRSHRPRSGERASTEATIGSGPPDDVWGLISDVHGNYAALEEALTILSSAGASRIACLGDYLGRGDNDRCVQRIREVAEVAILGNRDLDWQDRVSASIKAWVLELPRTACVGPLLLAHGDARLTPALGTSQIGRNFLRTWDEMQRVQARVFAFGHSHHARTWRKASASEPAEFVGGSPAEIEPGYRYFLNVGTTGLPFPGKGGPSVAVVDFGRARIAHLALDPNRTHSE
jgi:predicted phosphodiesterase